MKKKLLALFLGTTLVMGLTACGGGSSTSKDTSKEKSTNQAANKNTTETASDAQTIVNQKCTGCHGQDLQGQVGPSLQHIGSKYSKDQILDILKNGKQGGMPAGVISGSDADKVATWLAAKK